MNIAVFIGRFQPLHLAHLETMQRALATHDKLIVVIGSAHTYPNAKNPWSRQERQAMVAASLTNQERARTAFVYSDDDYYNDPRWFRQVRNAVMAHCGSNDRITIVGFHKDASSYYLNGFGDWGFEDSGVSSPLNATDVRNAYFAGLEIWQTMLPDAVREHLETFKNTNEFVRLQREWQRIKTLKTLDATYPYPINHVTVDAVVLCAERVLLVKRGGAIGHGAWALPGGYLETNETVLDGAIRELREETGFALLDNILKKHLLRTQVFDYPGRSLRGRTVTHAHLFDLGASALPEVHAQDDATEAFWLPLEELHEHRGKFHDDHHQILRFFLETK